MVERLGDGTLVAVDGGAKLQLMMTDATTAGVADTLAITIQRKSGGLWFANYWKGSKCVEQLLNGGELSVR